MKTLCFLCSKHTSAHQVEFREGKSSHTGIELTQRPSGAPRECLVDYKVPLSRSHYCYTSYTMRVEYF